MPHRDPKRKLAYNRRYYQANKESLRASSRRWHLKNGEYNRNYLRRYRLAALAVLGGRCVRCGFSDNRALQIDHVLGGGTTETRSLRQPAYLKKVIAEADSGRYQLLCANCNWIKRDECGEHSAKKIWAPDMPVETSP